MKHKPLSPASLRSELKQARADYQVLLGSSNSYRIRAMQAEKRAAEWEECFDQLLKRLTTAPIMPERAK